MFFLYYYTVSSLLIVIISPSFRLSTSADQIAFICKFNLLTTEIKLENVRLTFPPALPTEKCRKFQSREEENG